MQSPAWRLSATRPGVRLAPQEYVLPPTPPPDIDIEQWHASLARIEAWRPDTLFLTHFGPSASPPRTWPSCAQISNWPRIWPRTSLAREGSDEDREAWFVEEFRQLLVRRLGQPETGAYETANRLDLNWRGLARYWRKRGA